MKLEDKENRYFHVTVKENLESILEKGLIPRLGERSKEIGEEKPAVFLFPNAYEMETALYNWLGECFEEEVELVILQIDLPEDFPIHRDTDSNGELFYEAYCYEGIPAEYVTGIYNEEYEKYEEIDIAVSMEVEKEEIETAICLIEAERERDLEEVPLEH